jgi:hypothetical protein
MTASRGRASPDVCRRWLPVWLPAIRPPRVRRRRSSSPVDPGRAASLPPSRHGTMDQHRGGPTASHSPTAASRSPRPAGTARPRSARQGLPAHRNQKSCRGHDATPAACSCQPVTRRPLGHPSAIERGRIPASVMAQYAAASRS